MYFSRLRLLATACVIYYISHFVSANAVKDKISTFNVRIDRIHPSEAQKTYQCSFSHCPIKLCLKQFQHIFKLNENCAYGLADLDFPKTDYIELPLYGDTLMNDFTLAVSLFSPDTSNVTYPETFTDVAQSSTTWKTRIVSFKSATGDVEIELRYRIVCADGFSGEKCNKIQGRNRQLNQTCNADMCMKGVCNDHGSCECFFGFTGPKCDQCIPSTGCQGYCNVPGECLCPQNYGGKNCAYDLTKCQSTNMCRNGGTCDVDANGDFSCRCPPGFTGPTCNTAVRSCLSSPCINNGTCHMLPDNSDFVCECPEGLTGRLCQKRATSCSDSPCFNGAICKNGKDQKGFTCECNNNWTGRNCDIPITLCKPDSCVNGAKCIDAFSTDLGYRCECVGGFYGLKCDRRLRDYVGPNAVCKSFKCHNNGICIQRKGQPSCDCPVGYSGFRCETDVNECHESKCLNGGYCADLPSTKHCICPRGFYGAQCQFSMTLVHDNDFFLPPRETEFRALPTIWHLLLIVIVMSIFISVVSKCGKRVLKKFQKQSQSQKAESPLPSKENCSLELDPKVTSQQKCNEFCSSAPGAFQNCEQCLTHSPPNPRQNKTFILNDNRYVDGPWRPRTPEALREAASKHQLDVSDSPENIYHKISYETVPVAVLS